MNKRFLPIKKGIKKYKINSADTIELVSELVGIDAKVIKELVEEYGTIQNACRNTTFKMGKITPRKAYKLHLLGEILNRSTYLHNM